jgi:hypothetical protein
MDLQYTVFEYLYREAGKGKTVGRLLLTGSVHSEDIDALKDCLENGFAFIAERVGIPPLYAERWTVSSNEEDYDLHEFVCMRPATIDEILELRLFSDLDGLMRKFEEVSAYS